MNRAGEAMATWIVLLEAVRSTSAEAVNKETLSRLLEAVGHARPIGLHSPGRYAVQFHLPAVGPLDAVNSALSAWSAALGTIGVAPWELVRVEVMTEAELAAELNAAAKGESLAFGPDEGLRAAFDAAVSDILDEPSDTAMCALNCDLRWGLLLQGSHDWLTVLSADQGVLLVLAPGKSGAAQAGAAPRRTFADFVHPEDAEVVGDAMEALRTTPGERVSFVARLGGHGQWGWYESVARNLLDEPLVGAIVVNSRDITQIRQLEERLAQLAVRDELTGLLNRMTFLDQLELAMARSTATSHVAVFFVDVIDFRGFLDRHGTPAGDQVLLTFAERLTGVHHPATAARLGGDEFALLCEGVANASEASEIAKRISSLLGAPLPVEEADVSVGVSIGVALGTSGMLQPATLLRHAEVAMYRARRGQLHFDMYKTGRQSRSNTERPPS